MLGCYDHPTSRPLQTLLARRLHQVQAQDIASLHLSPWMIKLFLLAEYNTYS